MTVKEAKEEEAKTVGAEEQAIVDLFMEKHKDLLSLMLELEAQPVVDNLGGCGRGPRHYGCTTTQTASTKASGTSPESCLQRQSTANGRFF
ncbi:hypothetical protein V5O48_018558 [Marasmius crinis-equi]|uniref:Uncharacterized protein n=1 Tax=Marasmius crinis-equi TaxID=585013 RepID=A0ABR3EKX0_9AGAR